MTGDDGAVTARLAAALRSSVNGDGGWGYSPGKASRLEPTCWAVLALLNSGAATDDAPPVDAALARMAAWQRGDGLLSELPSAPPNLAFNGLAAVVIHRARAAGSARDPAHEAMARRLLAGILAVRGTRVRASDIVRQDGRLTGWPWIDGTFSWLEPTAWCLLALKTSPATRPRPAAMRIDEAERLLADRCCAAGGWNYGNSNAFGRDLFPYVPTTALGLLALRGRREPSGRPASDVVRSLAWLSGNWSREVSLAASSLALVAMRVHGMAALELAQALGELAASTQDLEQLASTAMALYALTGAHHEYAAFTP